MKINYIYSNKPFDSEPYASITVDLEVLNWLKSMVEDMIVDYARVQNFDGINEMANVRKELMYAIYELTPETNPEPFPEPEKEDTDEEE